MHTLFGKRADEITMRKHEVKSYTSILSGINNNINATLYTVIIISSQPKLIGANDWLVSQFEILSAMWYILYFYTHAKMQKVFA